MPQKVESTQSKTTSEAHSPRGKGVSTEYRKPVAFREATQLFVATAYHEAGHTVAALVFNFPILQVSMVRTEDRLGHCLGDNPIFGTNVDKLSSAEILTYKQSMVFDYAGYQAELLVRSKEKAKPGAVEDFKSMADLALILSRQRGQSSDCRRHVLTAIRRTQWLLRLCEGVVRDFAAVLAEEQIMSGGRVKEATNRHPIAEIRARVQRSWNHRREAKP
jgi:ATP-dependent Zn protease